jgi:hypothetical protein
MSAIINNSFRKYQADNFRESFDSNNIYLAIGKNDPWAGASAGEYVETTPSDTSIPIPIDTTVASFLHHNDMIAMKKITSSSTSHVLKRVDWESGTVYVEYSHLQDDIIDQDFFVFTEDYNVYKCISNNGGVPSTVKPTNDSVDIIETADGYRWKFMFEVQQADVLKYITTDWIPVKYLEADDSTAQWNVQQAAVDGALEHITVTAGGSGYRSDAGTAQVGNTANTIQLATTAVSQDDYYNGMTVYITSGIGAGEFKTITDYQGDTRVVTVSTNWTNTPTDASVYQVMPAVSVATTTGSGAIYRVSGVTGGAITTVTPINKGIDYRNATATVTTGDGSGCVLLPRISPTNGHGKDPVAELGGTRIMLNTRLIGLDGNDFPINDDFRKVHLIVNPKESSSPYSLCTSTTYSAGEVLDDSGSILYTEFRAPINRAPDSTEDIKLVIEF